MVFSNAHACTDGPAMEWTRECGSCPHDRATSLHAHTSGHLGCRVANLMEVHQIA